MTSPLELVKLTELMERTSGRAETKVAIIDGPVLAHHPDLAGEHLYEIAGNLSARCTEGDTIACLHGTFVAGILCAKRGSIAPAICPNCTFFLRPIFTEKAIGREPMFSATPQELATAIADCIREGARVINLSLALEQPSINGEQALEDVLNHAAKRGVLVVAAAGNQGTLGSSAITRHPWVIPVAACDLAGRPAHDSNVGHSIGRRGLSAPGKEITSLSAGGGFLTLGGTSVAAPFVTGAIALLWSEFPHASASQVMVAVGRSVTARRTSVVPPLLNAAAAYASLL